MKKMKRNKNVCGEERLNNFYLNFVYALRVYINTQKQIACGSRINVRFKVDRWHRLIG